METEMQLPSDEDAQASYLKSRFGKLAHYQALPLQYAANCWSLVKDFIENGVAVMKQEGVLNDERRILEAESNLKRFVAAMREEGRRMGLDALHEPTADKAKHLCPLWPFC
jgi:hypothetical protein